MIRIFESNRAKLITYLLCEPYFNTYILGDIEVYGLDGNIVKIYISESKDIDFILMEYDGNYVIYSKNCLFDASEIGDFIKKNRLVNSFCISGKAEAINRIRSELPGLAMRTTKMACLSHDFMTDVDLQSCNNLRKLEIKDREQLLQLYLSIDEFSEKFKSYTDEQMKRLFIGGRVYGIFSDTGILLASAASTAESQFCAMITNVCVHPDHRNLGYSKIVLSALIKELFSSGLGSVCLYYDNPIAEMVYGKLGFNYIGTYATLR